jgi:curli production assembly/transport component CsgE
LLAENLAMLSPSRPSLWILLGSTLVSSTVLAATQQAAAPASQPANTLGGIVVSRTVTVSGQDFSQHFLSAWRDKPGSDHYTLAIYERPSARWGSEVWIEYAQRRVFQMRLPTMRAALRQAGERAADATYQAVLQADRQRKLVNDADLAPDEF